MKLKELSLTNFRGFDQLVIPFDGKSTIIFGVNGVGKSTILRSIDLIYANLIARLMTSKKKLAQLEYDDISYGKSRADIKIEFEFTDEATMKYGRSISRSKGRVHNSDELRNLADAFEERYIEKSYEDEDGNWIEVEDIKDMPIFVNYGVNRAVWDVPVRVYNKEKFTKLSAFDKAIESKIDFRTLFRWFRNQEDIENQERARGLYGYEDISLAAVKKAMLSMLDGFEDIHIERRPLAMVVKKNGRYLKINQLSDGEKCTIALFGDLARRMTLANPKLENPLEGTGVVLIDELDLHMHTSWQRKVMRVLKETFPNIQFIITTHSPQILGEINEDFNLYYLINNEGKVSVQPYKTFIGWDSNVILEDVMDTSSVNVEVKRLLSEMYCCIEDKKYGDAERIADLLDEISNGHVVGVSKARVLISRGRRNEKNS